LRYLFATAELLIQDGGCDASILLLSLFVDVTIFKGQNLPANHISSTYLNSGLKYNYFRFGKKQTSERHTGILLPVWILITSLQSACYFASRCPILSISDHLLRKYDVISILQDGGPGCLILLPVSYLLMPLPSEGQNLSANQILSTNVRHIGILLQALFSTILP